MASASLFTGALSEEVNGQGSEWVLGNGVHCSQGLWRALVWSKYWKDSRNMREWAALSGCCSAHQGLPAVSRVGQSRTLLGGKWMLSADPGCGAWEESRNRMSIWPRSSPAPLSTDRNLGQVQGHSVLRLTRWYSSWDIICLSWHCFSLAWLPSSSGAQLASPELSCVGSLLYPLYWFTLSGGTETPVASWQKE